ncbi:MAG: 2-C-methyl-D-erythritol 4-phosphate cytidylyltransferase [Candidatus Omnitrophica bacterium]|nr:2-C-methyl-D-erythritol 4-phosphate cytidylyltransferase [Candidatus Omnitrophota bacterium]
MLKIAVIIPAAGTGQRLGYKTGKPYIKLNNKALVSYCLEMFEKTPAITDIIIAVEKAQLKKANNLVKLLGLSKLKAVVCGGVTRSESVYNALKFLAKDTDYVLIHDAARPFVNQDLINSCITAAVKYKAVICAVPCMATIKSVDKNRNVISTLDRNSLWQVQTPQAFSYKLIMLAYAKAEKKKLAFFDDASLVEKIPHKVKIVMGFNNNIKITTKEDLELANAILKAGKRFALS